MRLSASSARHWRVQTFTEIASATAAVHKPVPQRTLTSSSYACPVVPLPQTPDEKARKQPPAPKVPTPSIETPLNPANFRSLQRGALAGQRQHVPA
ncbi:hypothetical protein NQ317_007153 [Molorchus minor]|uniref:Uncharacterized protein n=1 Tax=Molorchus minor TaxID=1323400 RepID=A0ABQ9J6M0_9CUCU|nr:hypothetical protein NQ317_007153 [Molorchus minor]